MVAKWREIILTEKDNYSFKPEFQIILFGLLVCVASWIITDIAFFGHKSRAIFDVWTLTHVAAGAVISFFTILMRSINFQHPIMLLLLISFGWEIVEHYIEISQISYLADWFAGEERIENRLVADQIAVVVGYVLIKWKPKIFPLTLLIAVGVLGLHIFLGDSMYFFR